MELNIVEVSVIEVSIIELLGVQKTKGDTEYSIHS